MEPEDYRRRKAEKAQLIIEKAREIARKSRSNITSIEWDSGTLNTHRVDFHKLTIVSGDKSIQENFYDENLSDFPFEDSGVVVNKLRKMIADL